MFRALAMRQVLQQRGPGVLPRIVSTTQKYRPNRNTVMITTVVVPCTSLRDGRGDLLHLGAHVVVKALGALRPRLIAAQLVVAHALDRC